MEAVTEILTVRLERWRGSLALPKACTRGNPTGLETTSS